MNFSYIMIVIKTALMFSTVRMLHLGLVERIARLHLKLSLCTRFLQVQSSMELALQRFQFYDPYTQLASLNQKI